MAALAWPALALSFSLAWSLQGFDVSAESICSEQCQRDQRSALQSLYRATGGANWNISDGWQPSGVDSTINVQGTLAQHCNWFGVTCCQPNSMHYPFPTKEGALVPCDTAYGVVGLLFFQNNMVCCEQGPAAICSPLLSSA